MTTAAAPASTHGLHAVQPVLAVADVDAAVAWFSDVLGFDVDFVVGVPAGHARVKTGDRRHGDPVMIHLTRSDRQAAALGGELRLHVGDDIDGLHAALLQRGADVESAPADRPWGLREFVVVAPGGHRLRFCGYLGEPAAADAPRTVIARYRPRPGQGDTLAALVRLHVPTLQRLGLATDRAPFLMKAADGSVVEVFEWASADAIASAHGDADVLAMWQAFDAACEFDALATLPEAAGPFAEFQAI